MPTPIPAPVVKQFTFDPNLHLSGLRHLEWHLGEKLKTFPSPNRKNGPCLKGDFSKEIAENYESLHSLRAMIAETATECDQAICECEGEGQKI